MNKNKIFINIAKEVSNFSKDPRRKIGAISVDNDKKILSTGYNGFPRGILDSEEDWNNREIKNKFVVHAEANMVYNATYTGVSLKDSTIYVYGLPVCSNCALSLIQSGVKKVIYYHDYIEGDEKWIESFKETQKLFTLAGIEVEKFTE